MMISTQKRSLLQQVVTLSIQILTNQRMLIVKNKKATLDQRTKREGNNHLLKKGESNQSSPTNMRKMRRKPCKRRREMRTKRRKLLLENISIHKEIEIKKLKKRLNLKTPDFKDRLRKLSQRVVRKQRMRIL